MSQDPSNATQADAQQVLRFWLGDALELGWPSENRSALWFQGGAALDRDIGARFGKLVENAMAGSLSTWEQHSMDCLALVILLDQFSRNVYRGKAQAFAGDARAQALVARAIEQGWDAILPLAGTVFLYMPLMHAENLALQDKCVRCFENLLERAPAHHKQKLQGNLDFAVQHRDIIARFGRFPYRNAVMGRNSTDLELTFLRDGPRFGQ